MSSHSIAGYLDGIASHPDCPTGLREATLALAVRGALVPQNPSDEPAQNLLEQIRSERERVFEDEGWKKRQSFSPVTDDDLPFSIPNTWAWTRLDEACIYDCGKKHNPTDIKSSSWILDLEDIEKATGSILATATAAERIPTSTKAAFKLGDVLYGKLRPYLNKCVVAPRSGYCTTEIIVIRLLCDTNPDYIALALRAPFFVNYVTRMGKGAKMPRLRTEDGRSAMLPLPPLAEQKRIVAKVEELMGLCDELEAAGAERERQRDRLNAASLHRIAHAPDDDALRAAARFHFRILPRVTVRPDQIPPLRQTILNLAVRGKLVEQDMGEEPVETLLSRIGGNSPAEVSCDLHIPPGWECLPLEAVLEFVTSGSRGWAQYYSDEGAKFVRAQNIRFGRLKLNDLAHVNPPKKTEGKRTAISEGDLLMVITGAGVTNPALMDRDLGEAYVSQHVGLIRPKDINLSDWLLLCLMAPAGCRNLLLERAYGAGKPGLNLGNIRSLPLPLPPLAEQRRIVAKVDELMALCNELETSLTRTQTESRRLLDAIMAEVQSSK